MLTLIFYSNYMQIRVYFCSIFNFLLTKLLWSPGRHPLDSPPRNRPGIGGWMSWHSLEPALSERDLEGLECS